MAHELAKGVKSWGNHLLQSSLIHLHGAVSFGVDIRCHAGQVCMLPIFVNEVFLEHSYTQSFMYWSLLLSYHSSKSE